MSSIYEDEFASDVSFQDEFQSDRIYQEEVATGPNLADSIATTDQLEEGTSNLYYTAERSLDDFVSALSVVGITADYDDAADTLTLTASSVAGNDTEIQFNNNGSFGANSALTYDGETFLVQAQTNQSTPIVRFNDQNGVSRLSLDSDGLSFGVDATDFENQVYQWGLYNVNDNFREQTINLKLSGNTLIEPTRIDINMKADREIAFYRTDDTRWGRFDRNGLLVRGRIRALAKTGQTNPILQLDDENNSSVFEVQADGTLTPDGTTNAVSGNFTDGSGGTVTVTNGVITSLP